MSIFTVTPETRIALELVLLAVAALAALLVAHSTPAPAKQAAQANLRVVSGSKVKLG